MAKAVEGMISEKDEIFYSFCGSLSFFMLVTISSAIITMTTEGYILTIIIIVIGGVILYKKSRKLYIRFLVRDDHAWKRKRQDDRQNRTVSSRRDRNRSEEKSEYEDSFGSDVLDDGISTTSGLSSRSNSSRRQKHELLPENKIGESALDISPATKSVNHEGYLWKRGRDHPNSVKKRYFVVYDNFSKMDYYENQSEFVRGERPIKNRPINLQGYEFVVVESPEAGRLVEFNQQHHHHHEENKSGGGMFGMFHHKKSKKGLEEGLLDTHSESESTSSGSGESGHGSSPSSMLPHAQEQFEFVLRPVRRDDERRNWEFVVGSNDELMRWKSVFSKHT
jgi:ABC-type nickel/cobalt efflux system permease component RcnA